MEKLQKVTDVNRLNHKLNRKPHNKTGSRLNETLRHNTLRQFNAISLSCNLRLFVPLFSRPPSRPSSRDCLRIWKKIILCNAASQS